MYKNVFILLVIRAFSESSVLENTLCLILFRVQLENQANQERMVFLGNL